MEWLMIVGWVGLMILVCGIGFWWVCDLMNVVVCNFGMICLVDIGLVLIEYICIDDNYSYI